MMKTKSQFAYILEKGSGKFISTTADNLSAQQLKGRRVALLMKLHLTATECHLHTRSHSVTCHPA